MFEEGGLRMTDGQRMNDGDLPIIPVSSHEPEGSVELK